MFVKLSENWVINTSRVNEVFLTNGGEGKMICVNYADGESSDKEYKSNAEAKADFERFVETVCAPSPEFAPDYTSPKDFDCSPTKVISGFNECTNDPHYW